MRCDVTPPNPKHKSEESEYENAGRGGLGSAGDVPFGGAPSFFWFCHLQAGNLFLCASTVAAACLPGRLAGRTPPTQDFWKLPEGRRLSCRVRGVPSPRLPTSAAMLL